MIDDPSALIHVLEEQRTAAILFVGSSTEPSPGAALLASEPGFARLPFADDRTFIVDAESGTVPDTLPFPVQKRGPRINGDGVRNTCPSVRAGVLDSVVRDITLYTRPLRQARLRVQELATANRRKDEFLAILSHELRSPLAAIQNCVCFLISQTGENAARQRAHALIQRQVRQMTQLVEDLLDVSRISHGHLHLQRERIDLRVVVSNAVQTLEADINQRHHRLTTALPAAPVWLQADPRRLEQVFVNLLANASRYTEAGGELAVGVHARDGQAVVRIRDSGIGIAPDALPHIFDLFGQVDEAAPRSKSGLGIGLALVRNLVELHGGSVTAESAGLKQGSEFTVRLPREALKTTKQERRHMNRKGAEALAAVNRMSPASEGFTGIVHGRDRLGRPQSGWDPYEVWMTRVKGSSSVMQECEREPLRERVRLALRARAGAIARAVQPG